jgi:GntR family transcriptional regulator
MFFDINTQNGVPVYEQVFRQIAFAVASGGIEQGELVPSVRNMARELAINPNTVARAYRQLQDDGIVENVRGSGLAVTRTARTKCKTLRVKVFKKQISSLIEDANNSQLSLTEIEELIDSEFARLKKAKKT